MNKGKILFGLLMCLPVFLFLANDRFEVKQSSLTLYAAYVCDSSNYGATQCAGSSIQVCLPSSGWTNQSNCTYGCTNGVCNSAPTPTPVVCNSSHCGNCANPLTCQDAGCNWSSGTCAAAPTPTSSVCSSSNYGATKCAGSSIQVCLPSSGWTTQTTCTYGCANGLCNPTPAPSCSSSNCGNCGSLSTCNANSGCNWSYSGNYCEMKGCFKGGNMLPIGIKKCGDGTSALPDDNTLYTCTSNGWVGQTSSCTWQAVLSGDPLAFRCQNPDVYADSGCSTDHLCTGQGGSCTVPYGTAAGSACQVNGQSGNVKVNLCLSLANFEKKSCCVPAPTTCDSLWAGSSCTSQSSCPVGLRLGRSNDCSLSIEVCCASLYDIVCMSPEECQLADSCQECINPGTLNSRCRSTRTAGGSGSVGGANGGRYDIMPTSGLCNSSYGTTVTDSVGSDGTFNWTCEGQNSGSCRSAGSDAYGSATKCINQPVINGACHSNVTGTSAADLCYLGTPVYVSGDDNHDYISDLNPAKYVWGCQGSRNTCAEGDGDDRLDCQSIMDQEPWYQVKDGSILAKGTVENYVPPTCTNQTGNTCNPSTVINGEVYSRSISSLSNFDQSSKNKVNDLRVKTFPYNDLKNDYFDKKGVGTTFSSNSDWSSVKNAPGVIFVDGDLQITENLDTANFVMIVAKGTITIDPTVTQVNGVLVANKVVAAEADTETTASVAKLVVNGMVHGVNGVEFSRSLLPANLNNTSPSVEVKYNPKLLFMIPNELSKVFDQWKIN